MAKVIKTLCLVAVFLATQTLFSQTGKLARHDAKDFSYGIKAGMNMANLSGEWTLLSGIAEYDDLKSRMGLVVGAFGTLKLGTDIGVSAELLYSQQGAYQDDTTSFNLDYLNVPLLVNWYVPWVKGLTIKGGLQPAFLLSSELQEGKTSTALDDNFYSSFSFSIPLGVSYELDFGLFLDLRYNIGLINVWHDDLIDSAKLIGINEVSHTNSVFQITLGYRF